MSDLGGLGARSHSFPEMGSSLVALGFEAAAYLWRQGWRSCAPDYWKVKEVRPVTLIASVLFHNPFAWGWLIMCGYNEQI